MFRPASGSSLLKHHEFDLFEAMRCLSSTDNANYQSFQRPRNHFSKKKQKLVSHEVALFLAVLVKYVALAWRLESVLKGRLRDERRPGYVAVLRIGT